MVDGRAVTIRWPQKSDLKDMLEILGDWYRERETKGEEKKRRDPRDKNWWFSRFASPKRKQAVTLILELDGKAIGMVDIKKNTYPAAHTALLSIIFIAKKYRHKSLGKILLQSAVSEARKILEIKLIILETNADNTYAIKLYRSCGFQQAGLIKGSRLYCGKYVGRLTMVKYFSK
jgi:ribosomal protein S18 acetylase RimI-like enzyme